MEKRFYDISILRVMAMLLVVYYHCICPYYVWSGIDSAGFVNPIYEKVCFDLTGIHMPLFFLIAGYLFGYKRFSRGGVYRFTGVPYWQGQAGACAVCSGRSVTANVAASQNYRYS